MNTFPFWSVGYVGAQNVFKFQQQVKERLKINIYFPVQMRKLFIRRMSKYRDVRRPVYGGYVFVMVEDENTMTRLVTRSGFHFSCIKNKSSFGYVKVLDSEIARLIKLEAENGFVYVEDNPRLTFAKGRILVIKAGPFEGEKALVMENYRNQRFIWANVRNRRTKIPVAFFKEKS